MSEPLATTPAALVDLGTRLDKIEQTLGELLTATVNLAKEITVAPGQFVGGATLLPASTPAPDPFAFLAALAQDYVAIRAATAKK
jgi:hypothetical protein